ncbi:uncharacterized protein LOC125179129 [Hyalella azteca]|uniref:Uncharacterized protein LOC125179129 n=1 Tax=Hyalella azteca TaxID=294128 RepID=A0A979FW33_HYAAZ|nr:uncharacterized protein LOC125179129 [Hyalella azteca]
MNFSAIPNRCLCVEICKYGSTRWQCVSVASGRPVDCFSYASPALQATLNSKSTTDYLRVQPIYNLNKPPQGTCIVTDHQSGHKMRLRASGVLLLLFMALVVRGQPTRDAGTSCVHCPPDHRWPRPDFDWPRPIRTKTCICA